MSAIDQIINRHFSATTRKGLARLGIKVIDTTWLAGKDGSYANGETGYCLDDNGTHRIRTFREVLELSVSAATI